MVRVLLGVGVVASVAAAAPRGGPARGDGSCVAALDSMLAVFRRDYPGYQTRVAGREAAFAALTDSVRAVADTRAADADYNVCIPALKRVTGHFRDAHLLVWQGAPPAPAAPAAAPSGGVRRDAAGPPGAPRDDPDRPTLRRYDARTLVLRLPSLDLRHRRAVDSLVAAHRAALAAAPVLAVDLRGNDGGCTCTYDALMPLVATGPVRGDGLDVWASAANVAWFRGIADDPATPDTLRAEIRRVLPRLEASPDAFVPWDSAGHAYVPPAATARPGRVLVLVDSACASSCEDFVRAARQSRTAAVFSAGNTAGAGDYGNVRSVALPGWRRLRVATSRSHRLRAGAHAATDFVGLAPDVRLPRARAGGDAALAFALRHLPPARRRAR